MLLTFKRYHLSEVDVEGPWFRTSLLRRNAALCLTPDYDNLGLPSGVYRGSTADWKALVACELRCGNRSNNDLYRYTCESIHVNTR